MPTPDWTLDSDYEFAGKLTRRELAWEFLRRGKGYQRAWADFCAESADLGALASGLVSFTSWSNGEKQPTKSPIWDFLPPRKAGETIKEWEERVSFLNSSSFTKETLSQRYGRRWQLKQMYDPDKTPPNEVEFIPRRAKPLVWSRREDIVDVPYVFQEFELGAYTWVDLTSPLDAQLNHLSEVLGQMQERLIADGDVFLAAEPAEKTHEDLLPHYLQLLDADNLNVSKEDIAKSTIAQNYYPDKLKSPKGLNPVDAVKERLKAARAYAEWKYTQLLPNA